MSVTINLKHKELTNQEKWAKVKNGDYVIADSINPPLPEGLYRIFFSTPSVNEKVIIMCPLFPISNEDGIFPIIIQYNEETLLPNLNNVVTSINIDVEVSA